MRRLTGLKRAVRAWFHPDPREIHPWRWRALTAWIVIFSVAVFVTLALTRSQTVDVTKLERTNCGLKIFLLTARRTRLDEAKREVGQAQADDLAAAEGYRLLAERFTAIGNCKIPKRLVVVPVVRTR